ncbi:protein ZAR1-like 1.L [Mantella aurantiaca]
MAGVMYPQYPMYPNSGPPLYRQPPPFYKPRPPYWKPPYKGVKPPFPLDCLDDYRWAQLKALLAQLGPGLSGLHYTREVGVQVNPRVDACVQCSLGPRTLRGRKGGPFLYQPGQQAGLRIVTPVRFPRTIAVYSRLTDRRLFTLPPARGNMEVRREDLEAIEEAGTRKPTFQFLEQKYGFFHCRDCQVRWESAYVWCVSGTNKVYFKQYCHKCLTAYNPYYVESIECKICMKALCSCPERRHIDLKRPHCQELCGRCKGQRLPCDKTYSFKYIV